MMYTNEQVALLAAAEFNKDRSHKTVTSVVSDAQHFLKFLEARNG